MTLKELNHNKAEIGTFEKNERLGDPGPALTFIFTMLTMEFWGIKRRYFQRPHDDIGRCGADCLLYSLSDRRNPVFPQR